MTFVLRQLHRRVFGWLTWMLPAILALGLLGMRFPVYTEIPDPQLHVLPDAAELEQIQELKEEDPEERSVNVRVEVFRTAGPGAADSYERWVRVTSPKSLRQPDLLVYWSSKRSTFDEPPLGAFLLGVLDPRAPQAFRLPPQSDFLKGYLVIYSLGQRVLITQMQLPQPA